MSPRLPDSNVDVLEEIWLTLDVPDGAGHGQIGGEVIQLIPPLQSSVRVDREFQ